MAIFVIFFQGLVHSGENITKIAIAEILHVGAGECLTLAKAATRVWKKYKISDSRERHAKAVRAGPGGTRHRGGSAMRLHHHGIFFCRIKIFGIEQPALQVES